MGIFSTNAMEWDTRKRLNGTSTGRNSQNQLQCPGVAWSHMSRAKSKTCFLLSSPFSITVSRNCLRCCCFFATENELRIVLLTRSQLIDHTLFVSSFIRPLPNRSLDAKTLVSSPYFTIPACFIASVQPKPSPTDLFQKISAATDPRYPCAQQSQPHNS